MKKIQLKPNFINPVTINSPSSIFAKLFTRNPRAIYSARVFLFYRCRIRKMTYRVIGE